MQNIKAQPPLTPLICFNENLNYQTSCMDSMQNIKAQSPLVCFNENLSYQTSCMDSMQNIKAQSLLSMKTYITSNTIIKTESQSTNFIQ